MKKSIKNKVEKLDIVAYGIGYDNGEDAIFVYASKNDVWSLSLPKKIGEYNIVFREIEGSEIEVTDDKFLGEVCSYWGEFDDATDIPDKYAYPMFKKSDKGKKIYYAYRRKYGCRWENPDGAYVDYDGHPPFDYVDDLKIVEVILSDGVPDNDREGYCYDLEMVDYGENVVKSKPQTELSTTYEGAREILRQKIERDIFPLQRTLKYLETLSDKDTII